METNSSLLTFYNIGEDEIEELARQSAQTRSFEGFEYKTRKDGTLEITGYTGKEKTVSVPYMIDSAKVTVIGKGAFFCRGDITSVEIPEGIVSINKWAFAGCTALESVRLPGSLCRIEKWAFADCIALMSADIPGFMTNIERWAFADCTALSFLNNNSRAFTDKSAFEGSPIRQSAQPKPIIGQILGNVISTVRPETPQPMISVNNRYAVPASQGSVNNTSPVLHGPVNKPAPADMTANAPGSTNSKIISLGDFNFVKRDDGNLDLTWYNGSAAVVTVPAIVNGTPVIKLGFRCFYSKNIRKVIIPDGIKVIGQGAFGFCTKLTSVTIPNSVTVIDQWAFSNCVALERIEIPKHTEVSNNAFWACRTMVLVKP